jgi:hypothetical protein
MEQPHGKRKKGLKRWTDPQIMVIDPQKFLQGVTMSSSQAKMLP